jgi:ABC-type lipoprotein release transport system permease subunit
MWKLAWRNLLRNRSRSIIAGSAITLTYAMLLVSFGIAEGMYKELEVTAVQTAGGNLLVHGEDYWERQQATQFVAETEEITAFISALSGVTGVVPRVLVNGLVSSSHGSSGVRLSGIVPELERQFMDVGSYLISGQFLLCEGEDELVIGARLAADLDVELGDRLVLTATDIHGEVVRALFHLSGLFETGNRDYDQSLVFSCLETVQEAIDLGEGVTQIGVLMENDEDRFHVQDQMLSGFEPSNPIEVLTWDQAMPDLVGYISLDKAFNNLYLAIVFLVVAFGIANTILMSVLERIREIGLLGALGMTPNQIGHLILAETLLLACFTMFLGFGLGFGIHTYFAQVGIDLATLTGGGDFELSGVVLTDTILYSALDVERWVLASTGVFLLIIFSSLYPALRATRVVPATAMRTYE